MDKLGHQEANLVIDKAERRQSCTPTPAQALHLAAFAIPAALFLLLVSCVLMFALHATHGHFVYALDDTYIHMAIAKNLSAHGVFGVTSHEFTSSSSSIVWPFLLAAIFKVVGPVVVAPFIAQIVIGIALLWLCWGMLRKAGVTSNVYAVCVLSGLVVALPMPAMTFVAMEHLLHALATVLFAAVALDNLHGTRAGLLPVLITAAAVTSVRYEGIFLVAVVGLLFLLEKRFFDALAIAAAGALPIVIFGLYSLSSGGFFLPNSLLLKRQAIGIGTLLRLRQVASDCPEVFVLAIAALLLLAFGTNVHRESRGLLKVFLLTALLHQMLAAYGWFYRYEAYLVALGLIAVAIAGWESRGALPLRRAWALATLVTLAMPLIMRGYNSIVATPLATKDIYRQQIQMAEFFHAYYPTGHIALNDIGAITFFGDPYCTDIEGLGNTEITRARISGHSIGNLRYILRENDAAQAVLQKNNVEVAAVYDDWFGFQQAAPPGWIRVGVWAVPDKTILGGSVVSFYGVGLENAQRLRDNLEGFHAKLPQETAKFAVP